MIPKIIHQTYKSLAEIPKHWECARQSVLKHNPEYTYIFWTDNDIHLFMRTYYPDFYHSTFVNYVHVIQQIDAFRYFVLYHYGGVYIDLDIGTKCRLDKYLNNDLVLVKSANTPNIVTNSMMMSSPGNAFMRQCMSSLKLYKHSYHWLGKHMHVMSSTGPLFISKQYKRYKGQVQIMSKEDFNGNCSVCNMNKCSGGNTFYQVEGNSWHSWDSRLYNYILCKWVYILLTIFVLIMMYQIMGKRNK